MGNKKLQLASVAARRASRFGTQNTKPAAAALFPPIPITIKAAAAAAAAWECRRTAYDVNRRARRAAPHSVAKLASGVNNSCIAARTCTAFVLSIIRCLN